MRRGKHFGSPHSGWEESGVPQKGREAPSAIKRNGTGPKFFTGLQAREHTSLEKFTKQLTRVPGVRPGVSGPYPPDGGVKVVVLGNDGNCPL